MNGSGRHRWISHQTGPIRARFPVPPYPVIMQCLVQEIREASASRFELASVVIGDVTLLYFPLRTSTSPPHLSMVVRFHRGDRLVRGSALVSSCKENPWATPLKFSFNRDILAGAGDLALQLDAGNTALAPSRSRTIRRFRNQSNLWSSAAPI
jgi:hypothetical protein